MGLIKRGLKPILRRLPIHKVTPQIVELKQEGLLQGRTALITGGTSGIENAIAKAYLKAGATVVITGRNQKKVDAAAHEIKNEMGVKAAVYGIELNMRDTSSFEQAMKDMLAIVPSGHIDILVNNAGVSSDPHAASPVEEFDTVLETNLKGVYFLSQWFAHYFKDNKIKGNILNIASSSSVRPATSAYGLSKWGIRGLTEGMARLLAPYGITVNEIAPGQTATAMMKG